MSRVSTLARLGRIASVPWQQRRAQGSMGSLWFTVCFTLFIPVLLLLGGLWQHVLLFIGAVVLLVMGGLLALGWWAVFVINIAQQAALPSSSLVPGHARHLGLAMWVVAGAISLFFGLAVGGLVHWFVVPAILTFSLLTLIAAFVWGWWPGLVAVALLAAGVLPHDGHRALDTFVMRTPAASADVTMLLAGTFFLCLWMLAMLAPSGRRVPVVRPAPAAVPPPVAVLDAVAAPAVAPAPVAAPVPPALGRGGALARALSMLRVEGGGAALLRRRLWRWLGVTGLVAAASTTSLAAYIDQAIAMLAFAAMLHGVDDAMHAWNVFDGTRREQQFIAMLPGLPRGAALGRAMALRLSAALLFRLAATDLGLGLAWALGGRHQASGAAWWASAQAVAMVPLACLPLLALQWKDWARTGPPTLQITLPAALAVFGLWGIGVGACEQHWTTLPAIAMACAGGTASWCCWRWYRIAFEPDLLPFGRLA